MSYKFFMNSLEDILELKNKCEKFQEKTYKKGSMITSYLEKRDQIFILLEGEAAIVRYDEKGNKDIVDFFRTGSIFGEPFYRVNVNSELTVEATKNCKVLTTLYSSIHERCKKGCTYHEQLNAKLLMLMFQNTKNQNTRIEILSKRTIREKLHSYFEILAAENFSNSITLPFSLTDLADFLSVNRSAMMRELKNLETEKIIQKISMRKIKLLYK